MLTDNASFANRFLARVNFGLMRFVRNISVGYSERNISESATPPGGNVTINITLVGKGESSLLHSYWCFLLTELCAKLFWFVTP